MNQKKNKTEKEEELKLYQYKGLRDGDIKVKDIMPAKNEIELTKILEKRGIYVSKTAIIPKWTLFLQPVKPMDISIFFNGIASMLDSGLSVTVAIDLLLKEKFNPKLILIMYDIKRGVNEGKSLPESIKETKFFPEDITEMIKVGNEAGKIIEVFKNLSEFYEQKHKINKAIRSATIKPLVIVISTMLIIIFLAPMMIDPMKEVYAKMHKGQFPKLSEIVINAVNWIGSNIIYILIGLFISIFLVKYFSKTKPKFKNKVDNLYLSLPLVGGFIKKLTQYKFFMSFKILYNAGIPVDMAMKMIANSNSNLIIKEDFIKIKESLDKGQDLTQSIKRSPFITDIAKSMISIGEETGKLSEQLESLNIKSKKDFEEYSDAIKEAMTPISTVLIGGVVGILVVAVYLPILSMIDLTKG